MSVKRKRSNISSVGVQSESLKLPLRKMAQQTSQQLNRTEMSVKRKRSNISSVEDYYDLPTNGMMYYKCVGIYAARNLSAGRALSKVRAYYSKNFKFIPGVSDTNNPKALAGSVIEFPPNLEKKFYHLIGNVAFFNSKCKLHANATVDIFTKRGRSSWKHVFTVNKINANDQIFISYNNDESINYCKQHYPLETHSNEEDRIRADTTARLLYEAAMEGDISDDDCISPERFEVQLLMENKDRKTRKQRLKIRNMRKNHKSVQRKSKRRPLNKITSRYRTSSFFVVDMIQNLILKMFKINLLTL
jgi:hypothetical protein